MASEQIPGAGKVAEVGKIPAESDSPLRSTEVKSEENSKTGTESVTNEPDTNTLATTDREEKSAEGIEIASKAREETKAGGNELPVDGLGADNTSESANAIEGTNVASEGKNESKAESKSSEAKSGSEPTSPSNVAPNGDDAAPKDKSQSDSKGESKKSLPPPPPAGAWSKKAETRPSNETSREKRERERRERDQQRLARSAKFGQKRGRSRSPGRNLKGNAGSKNSQSRNSLAEAKKKEAMAKFNPAQRHLLKRLHASKDYWARTRPSTAAKKEAKENEEKVDGTSRNNGALGKKGEKSSIEDVWHAAERGDLEFIKNHVKHERWDVRRHHDRGSEGFGATALHKACWGCHPKLVKWLIEHVERRYGVEERKRYVNCPDSHNSKVSPLIEASRTRVGFLPDRLEVLRLLFAAGADLRHKDAHGDNCLHWAARMGALPIVRFLLTMTEGAVWASMDENILRKRPIDIALERCCERVEVLSTDEVAGTASVRLEKANVGKTGAIAAQLDDLFPLPLSGTHKENDKIMLLATHEEYARDAVYAQLLKLVQGSNVRLKIQRNRERREAEKKRKAQRIQDERDSIIELARASSMDAQVEWLRQRQEAERIRQEDEDKHVHKIVSNAISDAKKFIDTREGKAEIKLRSRKIEKERREQAKANGEPAPKRIGKQCQAQARTEFIAEREQEATTQAKREFRRKNPADFDKRERKAIETARKKESARRLTVLRELDQRLKDDIDMDTGLCSEPHLNLNKFCASYTGW